MSDHDPIPDPVEVPAQSGAARSQAARFRAGSTASPDEPAASASARGSTLAGTRPAGGAVKVRPRVLAALRVHGARATPVRRRTTCGSIELTLQPAEWRQP